MGARYFCAAMPRAILIFLFLLGQLFLIGCITDNVIDAYEAQKRINVSYAAKLKQCNQPVVSAIIVPNDEQESDVRQCEVELLAAACPLNRTPPGCFLLLIKKAPRGDVDP